MKNPTSYMDLIMEVANFLYLRKPLKILGYLCDNLFLAYSWDRQFWMGEFLLLLLFSSYTADKKNRGRNQHRIQYGIFLFTWCVIEKWQFLWRQAPNSTSSVRALMPELLFFGKRLKKSARLMQNHGYYISLVNFFSTTFCEAVQ